MGSKYLIKERVEIIDQDAFTYIGAMILSISKRIINEVICTAEDNEIEIYYTDTDSQHLGADDIERLRKLYKEKYGRELVGKA